MLGLGRDPSTISAAVVRTMRHREDFEAGAVMDAEEAAEEMRHGMVAEIRRDIGDPKTILAPPFESEIQAVAIARHHPLRLRRPGSTDRQADFSRNREQ